MKSALEPSVPLLCVRDLCAEFGDFALQDIALEVWANERVGIVGESGSGKSLLAKLLMGLVQGNERGEIRFQGIEQNLATIPINSPLWRTIRAQKIAYIPQSPKLSLNPLHTIGKQLAEMCALHLPHTPKAKYQTLIDQALESVGLESTLKHRLPHTLSGGQAQRVCIAMMSLARPRLLICDEPTTARACAYTKPDSSTFRLFYRDGDCIYHARFGLDREVCGEGVCDARGGKSAIIST